MRNYKIFTAITLSSNFKEYYVEGSLCTRLGIIQDIVY